MGAYEALRTRYGMGLGEEQYRRHPTWSQRAASLHEYACSHSPVLDRFTVLTTFIDRVESPTEMWLFVVPREGDGVGVIVRDQGLSYVGIERNANDAINVYDRRANSIAVHKIQSSDCHATWVSVALHPSQAALRRIAFGSGIGSLEPLVGPNVVELARNADEIASVREIIRRTTLSQADRELALQIFVSAVEEKNRLLLSYYKGEIDGESLNTSIEQEFAKTHERLNGVLGQGSILSIIDEILTSLISSVN